MSNPNMEIIQRGLGFAKKRCRHILPKKPSLFCIKLPQGFNSFDDNTDCPHKKYISMDIEEVQNTVAHFFNVDNRRHRISKGQGNKLDNLIVYASDIPDMEAYLKELLRAAACVMATEEVFDCSQWFWDDDLVRWYSKVNKNRKYQVIILGEEYQPDILDNSLVNEEMRSAIEIFATKLVELGITKFKAASCDPVILLEKEEDLNLARLALKEFSSKKWLSFSVKEFDAAAEKFNRNLKKHLSVKVYE